MIHLKLVQIEAPLTKTRNPTMETGESSKQITISDIEEFMSDLRGIARSLLAREARAHSVRPTALVISGLRRCKGASRDWQEVSWENRDRFFFDAIRAMRQALIEYARKRAAQKRPDTDFVDPSDIDLYNLPRMSESAPERVVALEEAMEWLENDHTEIADTVKSHYYMGLRVGEIAISRSVSEKTIKRRLADGRYLLLKKICNILNYVNPTTS